MSNFEEQTGKLGGHLRAARSATLELTGQLRKINKAVANTQKRTAAACRDGTCSPGSANLLPANRNTTAGQPAVNLGGNLLGGLTKSLGSSVNSVLRSLVSGLGKTLAGSIKQQSGGGLFGGLLGGLVGGGLDLLAGKLFPKRQRVEVENTVEANIMNFPRLSDLGYATNPASRLLGGRSLPRGPAFTVAVDYRSGAEDIIAAKVTSHLAELNELHGRF